MKENCSNVLVTTGSGQQLSMKTSIQLKIDIAEYNTTL